MKPNQGAMYRIMFFHIPAWWTAMLAATIACYTNIAYLVTGKLKYDAWSLALTEVQLPILFTGLTTGMIWGRIIWGIWWTWDARLTSALVCWLLYTGYLMLRRGSRSTQRAAHLRRLFSIRLRRCADRLVSPSSGGGPQHPQPVPLRPEKRGRPSLDSRLRTSLCSF